MQINNSKLNKEPPITSKNLIKILDDWKIIYKSYSHEPVMSVKEAKLVQEELFGLDKNNGHIKNLYLRDKRKNNILIVAHQDALIDLKLLAKIIKMERLIFGSTDRLFEHLGVLPGAVSPFAMINGAKTGVYLFLDNNLKSFSKIYAHPLENDKTLEISIKQLEKFFEKISIIPNWIDLDTIDN
jgi:Ala-tRNA(Pro) deacylase